eukprot:Blabericola_migrator_1__9401@NODE_507_length_7957_cov_200_853612_g389_i0_p3_GENE_NODE_507_length_7957_cov_200_853612_g389_i0NODE_507_length_7957_cov_200_853612_g389_i0_p3_ORF_typecomplete_len470_score55_82_NODE_507_length_7957_cov_200_853612_g389_i064367845
MFSCALPAVLGLKISLYLADSVDLQRFFIALRLLEYQNDVCVLKPHAVVEWYRLLPKVQCDCQASLVSIEFNEDSINTEVARESNAAPRNGTVIDSVTETKRFQSVLEGQIKFALALIFPPAVVLNTLRNDESRQQKQYPLYQIPVYLDLTILGTERSTRLTFGMLKVFFRRAASQLYRLQIVTRHAAPTPTVQRKKSLPPPRDLIPADGVSSPQGATETYHVWDDRYSRWSPIREAPSQIWWDAESWNAVPHMPALSRLHISGPASMTWIGALRHVVTEVLEELVIQCWVADGYDPSHDAEALRDFLTNVCISNLQSLKLIVPPRFEILTPLVLRTVLQICPRTLRHVSFVNNEYNKYRFNQLFPFLQLGSEDGGDADADTRRLQMQCLYAIQEHLVIVSGILKDRTLRESQALALSRLNVKYNWLEFSDWVGRPMSLAEPSKRNGVAKKPITRILHELNTLVTSSWH